jgi:glycosyltransferase involved in cell wall biosynthesis
MKIVQVQNHPRHGGGADTLVSNTIDLLRSKGECVVPLVRRSRDLGSGLRGKFHAFAAGLYSHSAYKAMEHLIQKEKPDIVHVHDLYPLLVWVLKACGDAEVPVVMTCHNYRFTCPMMFHLNKGKVCERCVNGHEHWCILNNCRNSIFESTAFALHNIVARKSRLFLDNVTLFIALTEFSKTRLRKAGVPESKLEVLPNVVNMPTSGADSSGGLYATYVGRFSAEKGIDILLSAAALNPNIPVRLAGDYSTLPQLLSTATENVKFVGQLDREQLIDFYRRSRFVVVPSKWYEVCPMVVIEAKSYGLPVIASRIGSLKEMIDESVTGLFFEPGNAEDLAGKMKMLWENSDLCNRMGRMARVKAMHECDADAYYRKLIAIYEKAIKVQRS